MKITCYPHPTMHNASVCPGIAEAFREAGISDELIQETRSMVQVNVPPDRRILPRGGRDSRYDALDQEMRAIPFDASGPCSAIPCVAPEFQPFPKIGRLNRNIYITEKIDGTNASIHVLEDGRVLAASRNRYITPGDDNFGFAAFVYANADALRQFLGRGSHFGEWWGPGIQRGYGLAEKRFSLFNTQKWREAILYRNPLPGQLDVTPLLRVWGEFDTNVIKHTLDELRTGGSVASPGFMRPEGIIVFHDATRTLFKVTLEGDNHKG